MECNLCAQCDLWGGGERCFADYLELHIFVGKLTNCGLLVFMDRDNMLIKKILQFAAVAFCSLVMAGCHPDDPVVEKVAPLIMGQSITSGDTKVKVAPTDIIIIFDRPIELKQKDAIAFEPAVQFEASVEGNNLTITTLEAMQYLTDYTLTIGSGAVVDKATLGSNKERVISFQTEEGPYVPPTEPAVMLANPNAIRAAQDLYDYLWAINGRYTLSAASMDDLWKSNECDWVHTWTGTYPAILNLDVKYLYASPSAYVDYSDMTESLEWWDKGGLLSMSWHWMVPVVENNSRNYTCESSYTRFNINKMFTADTWENKVLKADLEKMAKILKTYQKFGIPILWTPLQEAVGNITNSGHKSNYWWGVCGKDMYKKLWHTMFDYFAEQGLDNLIWVWNTRMEDVDFFPGDDYVDIILCNSYSGESVNKLQDVWRSISGTYPHRMVALCELGRSVDMSRQLDKDLHWSYVMPWFDGNNDLSESFQHSSASISWWLNAFNDTRVLSRDEIPRFR